MGVIRAPVAGSGCAPACTAKVENPGFLSGIQASLFWNPVSLNGCRRELIAISSFPQGGTIDEC